MELKVYSVRDSKGEVYFTPFFNKTHGEAIRNFKALSNDQASMISKYPEDFDLYHLGTYNNVTGQIKPLDTPLHLEKAAHQIQQ